MRKVNGGNEKIFDLFAKKYCVFFHVVRGLFRLRRFLQKNGGVFEKAVDFFRFLRYNKMYAEKGGMEVLV